jgi:hypothetical protein
MTIPNSDVVVALDPTQVNMVFTQGFQLPHHDDIQITNSDVNGVQKPTYMTFRMNGTPVFYLMITYDGNGNLVRIQPD